MIDYWGVCSDAKLSYGMPGAILFLMWSTCTRFSGHNCAIYQVNKKVGGVVKDCKPELCSYITSHSGISCLWIHSM